MNPPSHWKKLEDFIFPPGAGNKAATVWTHRIIPGLNVMRSKSRMTDGSEWIHVSVARPDRLPSWPEIMKVKDEFIGRECEAYHIIPKPQDYVNVHRYCMHIWHPMSGPKLPNLQDLEYEGAI